MEINRYHLKSPVEIVTTKLGIPLNYKQQCIDEIYRIGDKQNQQTNVKAIMSSYCIWEETNLLNPLLKNLFKTINKSYPLQDKKYKYCYRDCWSAIYKKGHYTIPHNHHTSYLAFVFYLKTTPNSSPLVFNDCQFHTFPQDNMLVIFPGYLGHSVPKQIDNEDRICLAGNFKLIPKTQNYEPNLYAIHD